jgi:hypothetical protein
MEKFPNHVRLKFARRFDPAAIESSFESFHLYGVRNEVACETWAYIIPRTVDRIIAAQMNSLKRRLLYNI